MSLVSDIYPSVERELKASFPQANIELFHDTDSGGYEVHVYHPEVSEEISTRLDKINETYWQLFTIIQIPRERAA